MNINNPTLTRENNASHIHSEMSAMDKWIDGYEKRNGLPRSYQNYNNVQSQTIQNSNYSSQSNKSTNSSGMITMDEWMDNYRKRNGMFN